MPPTTHLLLGPRAADDAPLADTVAGLQRAGHDLATHRLEGPGHATRLARELATAEPTPHAIIAAGGDGTLNETLNGLLTASLDDPPALGVLPYGTANDFATFLGHAPDAPADALADLLAVEPRPVDVGEINGRYFLNVATAGLAAEATADTPAPLKSLLGETAYSISAFFKFVRADRPHVTLHAASLDWEGDLFLLILGNAATAGGGQSVAPDARLDDGLLDVILIPDAPPAELGAALYSLLIDHQAHHDGLITARVRTLQIETSDALTLNVDGETLDDMPLYHVSLHPRAMPLLMP
ncbi:MAG: YegS/Rv2252/BmrU family lipid kinase [Phycisphaeraceae bacterium]